MGIVKYLNLQMIPWCFHVLGRHASCLQLRPTEFEPPVGGTIKLIKSDGVVKIYRRPVHVSELMSEFPKHQVCRADSFYIGQKIPALSEDDELQPGHKYFLLPNHFFQSVLSFVTIASFASGQLDSSPDSSSSPISKDSRNAFVRKAAVCEPFHIQKTPSGCLSIRVSDEFISQLLEERKIQGEEEEKKNTESSSSAVCTTPRLQKEYAQLVSSRQWKPKLETIRETEKRKLSSFGMKRRKKSQPKGPQKITRRSEQQIHVTCTKPPSKAKIKIKSRKWMYI
ncbi:hypothetical protein I3843_06G105700 [Carya illinoinensis]|uniref:DUF4228 domain-containing protein n=1 Tax=Carya illinoinensis TaxID=32201 RepID=A0A8T1QAD3_CARIL|nr:uncharacterized protein LOC122312920 [Carya illinoinensis]KAG2702905.1 hypothetical protein I3760_06G112700 [Carya illinoinensis]KAG6651446.1 hypothetical protein CIPAW_06G111500 [Carya illinoinensis]KAG6709028.1 hypothetical protein I3842_06G111800 [Carya illinoinensis]KAG7975567.1 hypothetical protein I3843_06G105700 [Carya illinoinensis]